MGSRAEVGSSIRSTSGCTARGSGDAKPLLLSAGHAKGALFKPVLALIPDGRVPQGLLHDIVKLCLGVDAVGPGTVGDVVIDAHREGIGFLEHHSYPFSQLVHIHILEKCRLPSRRISPSMRQPSTRSFIRLMDLRSVDFPHPEGPINAVILCSSISKVHIF